MPTWNQIQAQLRHPNNPVVFFDVSVGTTVCISLKLFNLRLKSSVFFALKEPSSYLNGND